MGNCLNPASKHHLGSGAQMMLTREEEESRLAEMKRISQVMQEEEEEEEAQSEAAEGLKVKVVLTRAELEWLMAQLKSGERRLEDVLHHMQAAKGARADRGWRPSLESILECPETAPC